MTKISDEVTRYPEQTEGELAGLDGVVQRITYHNEENGYTIARFKTPRQKQLITIAGHMPGVSVGEGLRVEGKWVDHPQYGRQLSVVRFQAAEPGTVAALKRYLGSGLLRGVGPAIADQIVNTFGLDTLDVLDNHPERLAEVPGLGGRKARSIAATWAERRSLKNLVIFLEGQGLPSTLAARIIRKYGSAAENVVRQQPYRLAAEVYGVSFQQADALAAQAGIGRDSTQRIGAGFSQVLRTAMESGHCYLPVPQVVSAAAKLLALPPARLEEALPAMTPLGFLVVESRDGEGDVAYLPEIHKAEASVAGNLASLVATSQDALGHLQHVAWDTAWRFLASREPVQLSEEQQAAIRAAITSRAVVITGGPGTGKTTTLRGIVRLLQAKGASVALAAPTGRAAKRLGEATGAPASTLHRLLDLRPGGAYEVHAPVDANMVIIDEASMMDLPLADALFSAIPRGTHLVLVGDGDQLPPVGPGTVFRDVIDSGLVPVVTLGTIFRQPEGSAIVSNAHRINSGQMPAVGREISDFYFMREPEPSEAAKLVVDLVSRRLPGHFGLDPVEDIQVLVPIYGGVCGIDALNANLQAVLNPPDAAKDERRFGSRVFRVGDKVMQVVNDYDRQVSNGDLGRITRIDLEEESVQVAFESDWSVAYSFSDLDEITHAFAISVHKAQGSEYPAVVMPVLPQHGRMLQRNLLYTSVSRARRLVVLVGGREALARGVASVDASRRFTGLSARLRQAAATKTFATRKHRPPARAQ